MAVENLNRIYDIDQSKAVMLICKPVKQILNASCSGDKETIEKILKCPEDEHIELSK
jgi:hypothetical protein